MSLEILRFNYPEGMLRFCDLMRSADPVWIGRNGGSDTDFVELWDGENFSHPSVIKMRKLNGYFDKEASTQKLEAFREMYLRSSSFMDLCTVHMSSRFGASLEGHTQSTKTLKEKYGLRAIMCWRFIENATYFMESFRTWGCGKRILVVSPFSLGDFCP